MEFEVDGAALKELTRALTCLARFGDEVDLACTASHVKLSSVNSSRSAFGLFVFEPEFFSRYKLTAQHYQSHVSFSVAVKALLAPLKPRNATQIQTCTIQLTSGDPEIHDGFESRLVITLHCAHGVTKTHRLTYARANALYAKANRNNCTSKWVVSGKTLRELTDHFHLRQGAGSGGSEEISFYHEEEGCTLKSFGGEGAADDPLLGRPLSTELKVDSDDFDSYKTVGNPLVSISLKELKAIITLADIGALPLSAAFTHGGDPFLINLTSDAYTADFVIATTAYDSNSSVTDSSSAQTRTRRDTSETTRSESKALLPRDDSTNSSTTAILAGRRNGRAHTLPMQSEPPLPLFNPPSQEEQSQQQPQRSYGQQQEEEEFDFGGDEFDAAGFEELDKVLTQVENEASAKIASQRLQREATASQLPPQQQQQQSGKEEESQRRERSASSEKSAALLAPNTSDARAATATASARRSMSVPVAMQGIREETEGVATAEEARRSVQPVEEEEEEDMVVMDEVEVSQGPSRTQFGPTQARPSKKPKWNLLPEEGI